MLGGVNTQTLPDGKKMNFMYSHVVETQNLFDFPRTGYRGNLKVDYSLRQSAAFNMLTLANSLRRGNTVHCSH